MPRKYSPKPDALVDVSDEPTEAELDAIAARRPPPTPVELRSLERSVRVLHLGDGAWSPEVERALGGTREEYAAAGRASPEQREAFIKSTMHP